MEERQKQTERNNANIVAVIEAFRGISTLAECLLLIFCFVEMSNDFGRLKDKIVVINLFYGQFASFYCTYMLLKLPMLYEKKINEDKYKKYCLTISAIFSFLVGAVVEVNPIRHVEIWQPIVIVLVTVAIQLLLRLTVGAIKSNKNKRAKILIVASMFCLITQSVFLLIQYAGGF